MTRVANSRIAFEVVALEHADDRRRRPHVVAKCSSCNHSESIPVSNSAGNIPSQVAEKRFRQRGWLMGAKRTKDVCPSCQAADPKKPKAATVVEFIPREEVIMPYPQPAPAPEPTPANDAPNPALTSEGQKAIWASYTPEERAARLESQRVKAAATRAAKKATAAQSSRAKQVWANYTPEERAARGKRMAEGHARRKAEMASEPAPAEPTQNVPAPSPEVRAEPPREPTMVERRRIKDALDEHYDIDRATYLGNLRDASLAERLNLPRAWVAEVRSTFYGPDISEVEEGLLEEVKALRLGMSQVETALLEAVVHFDEEVEAALGRIRARRTAEVERIEALRADYVARLAVVTQKLGIK